MIATQLLDDYIAKSGLKISFIVETLGISRNAFDRKRKGLIPFRVSEVYVLCDILHIAPEDKMKIFYPKS